MCGTLAVLYEETSEIRNSVRRSSELGCPNEDARDVWRRNGIAFHIQWRSKRHW